MTKLLDYKASRHLPLLLFLLNSLFSTSSRRKQIHVVIHVCSTEPSVIQGNKGDVINSSLVLRKQYNETRLSELVTEHKSRLPRFDKLAHMLIVKNVPTLIHPMIFMTRRGKDQNTNNCPAHQY